MALFVFDRRRKWWLSEGGLVNYIRKLGVKLGVIEKTKWESAVGMQVTNYYLPRIISSCVKIKPKSCLHYKLIKRLQGMLPTFYSRITEAHQSLKRDYAQKWEIMQIDFHCRLSTGQLFLRLIQCYQISRKQFSNCLSHHKRSQI